MTTPEARYLRWRTTALVAWAVIGTLVLLGASLWVIGRISAALVPFVIAFIFVFLLNAPVRELSKRGMSRGAATLVCFVAGLLIVGGVITIFGPIVGRQVVSFANSAPFYVDQIGQVARSLETQFSAMVFPVWLVNVTKSAGAQISGLVVNLGNDVARVVVSAGSGVVTGFFDIVIAVVIAFWALRDLPKIREELTVVAGPKYEDDAEQLISTVIRVAGGYLKGQTIASFITGALAAIGFAIAGVPYPLVLGLIVFFFNYVPYVGPFTSALIAGLVGLFVGPWTALWAVISVIAAQQITDNFITPRVMSAQVDLHPTLVIFSLLVGGTLWGIPGLLFAIPVAATISGLFIYYYERKTQRQLVTEDGALFRGPGCETDEAGGGPDSRECGEPDEDANA